jgi:hypothetical protein
MINIRQEIATIICICGIMVYLPSLDSAQAETPQGDRHSCSFNTQARPERLSFPRQRKSCGMFPLCREFQNLPLLIRTARVVST